MPLGEALRLVAPVEHQRLGDLDGRGVGRVQVEHRGRGARVEALLAQLGEEAAHRDRHVAEVDVHRARRLALVADGAVVRHVAELVEVPKAHAAARLLLVEEGLGEERQAQDLVARAVEQVRARHVRRAHGLALAAAQAVLHRVGDRPDVAPLEDDGFVPDEREGRRVGVREVGAREQLAAVEAPFRIHRRFPSREGLDLAGLHELELGDADAVLARDDAAQALRQRERRAPPPRSRCAASRSRRSSPGCWCARCRRPRACAGR